MDTQPENLAELVGTLNDEVFEEGDIEYIALFETSSIGYAHQIKYLGVCLWCSENDERVYVDEEECIYESLEVFIRREANQMNIFLGKLRF